MDSFRDALIDDHAHCDALLRAVIQAAGQANWPLAQREAGAFASNLERHLLIEERIVFPAFEAKFPHAVLPTAALRSEHLRIRAVLERLRNSVRERDHAAFFGHAEALLLVMHQHSEKEEGVLYPMIERALGSAACQLIKAIGDFTPALPPRPAQCVPA